MQDGRVDHGSFDQTADCEYRRRSLRARSGEDLDASTIAQIREALLEHLVLVFRDQDLTPETSYRLRASFREIKLPPVPTAHGGPPEVNVIDQTDPRGEGADSWHADNTYTEKPPMGSLLRVLQLPTVGETRLLPA